jgi:hypothetical protein
MRSSSNNSY